jgi:lipopolysaccharide export system permease protein
MVSETGIWLKQEGYTTYSLVRVARVDPKRQDLQDVSIYSFDLSNQFINRLDSASVSIHPQGWVLKNACLSQANQASQSIGNILWKTDLTLHKIQESFAKPTSLPLWKLPAFISLMEDAGLSTVEHTQYFYKSLLQPFLLIVMAMLACLCAYHFTRHRGGARFIVSGLLGGFLVFCVQKISHALGLATALSPLLSVILPILFGALVSVGLLMHLEEK